MRAALRFHAAFAVESSNRTALTVLPLFGKFLPGLVADDRYMASSVAALEELRAEASAGPIPPGPTVQQVAASVPVQQVSANVPVATAVADRPPDLPPAVHPDDHLDPHHHWPDIPPGPFGVPPVNPALIPLLCLAPVAQALGGLGNGAGAGGAGGQPGAGGQGGTPQSGGGYFQPQPPPWLPKRYWRDWFKHHPPIPIPFANGAPGGQGIPSQPQSPFASMIPMLANALRPQAGQDFGGLDRGPKGGGLDRGPKDTPADDGQAKSNDSDSQAKSNVKKQHPQPGNDPDDGSLVRKADVDPNADWRQAVVQAKKTVPVYAQTPNAMVPKPRDVQATAAAPQGTGTTMDGYTDMDQKLAMQLKRYTEEPGPDLQSFVGQNYRAREVTSEAANNIRQNGELLTAQFEGPDGEKQANEHALYVTQDDVIRPLQETTAAAQRTAADVTKAAEVFA